MEKIKLYDENNVETEFYIDAKFTVDDTDYVALFTDEEDPEIYILKIIEDENGEELLSGIDDKELKVAQDAYEELISELE